MSHALRKRTATRHALRKAGPSMHAWLLLACRLVVRSRQAWDQEGDKKLRSLPLADSCGPKTCAEH